jgi:hypothetical protein
MPRNRHTAEQIIIKLRVVQVCCALGITEQPDYRWRDEYDGLTIYRAKRLKAPECENKRRKRAVAAPIFAILKEAVEGHVEIQRADGRRWRTAARRCTLGTLNLSGGGPAVLDRTGQGHIDQFTELARSEDGRLAIGIGLLLKGGKPALIEPPNPVVHHRKVAADLRSGVLRAHVGPYQLDEAISLVHTGRQGQILEFRPQEAPFSPSERPELHGFGRRVPPDEGHDGTLYGY